MQPKPYKTYAVGMIQVFARGKKGIYRARWSWQGKRVEKSLKVTNLQVALRKARDIDDALQRGDTQLLAARDKGQHITFSQLVDEVMDKYTGWSQATKEKMGPYLTHAVAQFGNSTLNQISHHTLQGYLARRIDEGLKTSSHNRALSMIRVTFKCAVRWGYMLDNPASDIPLLREEQVIPNALTDHQLAALLAHMKGQSQQIAILMADTGLRAGEVRRLVWGDIDFEGRRVLVRNLMGPTKSKRERTVPMTQRVMDLLQQRLQTRHGINVFSTQDIKKTLMSAAAAAKVGRVTPHMLRHTFATRLLDQGVPLNDVQYLMGHSTPVLTQRYDHPRPERHKRAIAALESKEE